MNKSELGIPREENWQQKNSLKLGKEVKITEEWMQENQVLKHMVVRNFDMMCFLSIYPPWGRHYAAYQSTVINKNA